MTNLNLRSICVVLALTAIAPDVSPIKVHTLGDSTMADYDEAATVTRGWGMYVGQFLTNGATAANYARGGRDSRVGYTELWATAKTYVAAGDYVFIQFAHNDEKNNGVDGVELYNYYVSIGDQTSADAVDQRGTVPTTTYKQYLRQIAEEAVALGANPIFVAPVCRSYFTGNSIRRNGRHDLGDSYKVLTAEGLADGTPLAADDHTMDYAYQMKVLAEEMSLPYIDLTTATRDLYESYGPAKCEPMLFDGAGSTHYNSTGATLTARLCMQLLKDQGILTDYINLTSSPADADLGEVYKGQILIKEFTLSGFDMEPADGSIRIEASEGIELSADNATWQTEPLSFEYASGNIVSNFYARVSVTEAGLFEGTVTITQGSNVISVPLTRMLTMQTRAMAPRRVSGRRCRPGPRWCRSSFSTSAAASAPSPRRASALCAAGCRTAELKH